MLTRSNKFLLSILLTQDLQIEQAQKYTQLGISKWSFYNIKANNKLHVANSWSFSEKRKFIAANNTISLHFILLNFTYFLTKLY